MPELMRWEQDVIVNSMLRKSSKEIATLLSIDEGTITAFIVAQSTGGVTRDVKLAERKARHNVLLVQSKARHKKKKEKPKITSAKIIHSQHKIREKRFETKDLSTDALVRVQIDHKTHIFIKQGIDPVIAKEKFLKSIAHSLNWKTYNPGRSKKI